LTDATVFTSLSPRILTLLSELGVTEPTPPQQAAVPRIQAREDLLLIAPTGSGKTEAALLPVLDQFLQLKERKGVSILYLTPLRALNRDMLRRILAWSSRLGFRVEVRHGDTPTAERRRQSVKPPDFLITTPETLQALLPAKNMRKHLSHVRWVIIDEAHQLAEDRRGIQLSVALQRLARLIIDRMQIIALSATLGNPDQIASLFSTPQNRLKVLHTPNLRAAEYFVEFPYATEDDHIQARSLYTSPEAMARLTRIAELVQSHRSTLIFVNSRTTAEMLASRLQMMRLQVAVHHSSLPREARVLAEERLKNGSIKAIICTSSLELGVDIGSVDLVIQYMSPRHVSTLIQRVGRSGHRFDRTSKGTILSVSTEDTLESLASIEHASKGIVEPVKPHLNALDVLAHQIAGIVLDNGGSIQKRRLLETIKDSYAYSQLDEMQFERVLGYMSELKHLRVNADAISATRQLRRYYYENLSMIPDERRYDVVDVTTNERVGILGEEFVLMKAKTGVNFIVKGRVWKILHISDEATVYVEPVEDPTAAIPGWDGEMLPIPYELAQQTGRLRGKVAEMLQHKTPQEVSVELGREWCAERYARQKIVEEIDAHLKTGAAVPTDRAILLEAVDRYLIVHASYGSSVNNTLGELFEEILAREGLVRSWWSDPYRILYELTVTTENLDLAELREKLFGQADSAYEGAFKSILHRHFPVGYYAKFIAQRFGVLKRGAFLGGEALKELALKFRTTPIYEEAIREAQHSHLDLPKTRDILAGIKNKEITVHLHRGTRPTPLAYHILSKYLEVPELMAPEATISDAIGRVRLAIASRQASLICFNCGNVMEVVIGDLDDRPSCSVCRSGLLAVSFWMADLVQSILTKKLRKEKLTDEEQKVLVRARRSADLILSYGKKAALALAVYGVGPQTASKILAKMHDDEEALYKDLLEAKLKFIQTRPYWDRA